MNNNVFFAENGLTSTSANHVANLAKEYLQAAEDQLASVKLYRSEVSLIGTDKKNVLQEGQTDDDIKKIESKLELVTEAKSLIAWLREAIKARNSILGEVENLDIDDWAEANHVTLPIKPVKKSSVTKEEIVGRMNIKERNRIFSLETKAATFGQYVHPKGSFADARKDYLKKLSEQNEIAGSGRDALLYHYEPTCSPDTIEDVFFALQKVHRETQAELNGILHDIDEQIRTENIAAESEYYSALSAYQVEMEKYQSHFKLDKERELKRIAALKIIIPNDLKDIYEIVNKLGK